MRKSKLRASLAVMGVASKISKVLEVMDVETEQMPDPMGKK